MDHIKQARDGEPAIHELRIRRDDGSFRWIRNTDFPLYDRKGNMERVGGIAEDVTETKMAVEHQGVLQKHHATMCNAGSCAFSFQCP